MTTEPKADSANPAAELPPLPAYDDLYGVTLGFRGKTTLAYGRQCTEHTNRRWKSALDPFMPPDFKDWHQNALSELPEIAAWSIKNLRQRIAELERESLEWRCRTAGQLEQCDNLADELRSAASALDRLRAENEAKEAAIADVRRLAAEIGQALDGAAAATAPSLCDLVEPVRELRMRYDMLRAESVIEWEPGRSHTAAQLLRRVIANIRPRKGDMLWPAVIKACGVGSTVAHYLCRWAGRDPDTGADLEAARAAREGK